MMREQRLKKKALEAMRFRGHKVDRRWLTYGDYPNLRFQNVCDECGKSAWIILHPLPNEIEISGEAVAVGCKDGP